MLIYHIGNDSATVSMISQLNGDESMIIISGDTTDGWDRGTMSGDTSWTIDDLCRSARDSCIIPKYEFPPQFFNGIKATETMVMLGRMYYHPKHLNHHRDAFRANKVMFSKSGYLPKRIRRIIK